VVNIRGGVCIREDGVYVLELGFACALGGHRHVVGLVEVNGLVERLGHD
jgi:hypothetical protein